MSEFGASSVEITDVTRAFDGQRVLGPISLSISSSSFHCLLGPSGCGKTTLLRIMAGLDTPDTGTVVIGGTDHSRTAAHRRPTNLVFQSGALFPHLSVADNIAFGLKTDRRTAKSEIRSRVSEILDLVAMGEYAGRSPATLSGGQRQRVAIARALVRRPDVLLLDEPLSALDLALQLRMRRELRRWQQETGTTFVCVTHNQAEAMEIADEIAVMNAGVVEQSGSARELYEQPASRFVAGFIGENNVFENLTTVDGGQTADGLLFPWPQQSLTVTESLAVRPEAIRLLPASDPAALGTARVLTTSFTGKSVRVALNTSTGREVLAELPPGGVGVSAGDQVGIGFEPGAVRRFGPERSGAAA
ncbi:ABC transporter ATP-binding protein [Kineosporia sp. J2-2]|uniref:ABC transporter ATP-binding protein n=1 Tax=Kineosporia corallincola TaxID=2835133 RepID=A0ABS5TPS4_9ACTN|nr:ABC transporter ATP-binding protein [Kineosporia corallincola]MBT0773107.1 ABC transporter ATP-binding protein [Kineosporia corallincola]